MKHIKYFTISFLVLMHSICFVGIAEKENIVALTYEDVSLLVDITGRIIIPPGVYESIEPIGGSEELFAIKDPNAGQPSIAYQDQDDWGMESDIGAFSVINKAGQKLTELIWAHPDQLYVFANGDILVKSRDKVGLLDSEFTEILDFIFDMKRIK